MRLGSPDAPSARGLMVVGARPRRTPRLPLRAALGALPRPAPEDRGARGRDIDTIDTETASDPYGRTGALEER